MAVTSANAFVGLQLRIHCKYTKYHGNRQCQVQLHDAIRYTPAYIFKVWRVATQHTTQRDKRLRTIVPVFKRFPVFLYAKGNFKSAGHCNYANILYTAIL